MLMDGIIKRTVIINLALAHFGFQQPNIGVIIMKNRIRKIVLNCLVTAFIYLVMYYLSYRVFREYLFVWTADNRYWYTWILPFVFIFLGKYIISYSITFGSIAGTFTGQYLGDYIQKIRMEKITLYSTAEERWHLSLHYGVAIWLAVILIFLVIGILLEKKLKKKTSS